MGKRLGLADKLVFALLAAAAVLSGCHVPWTPPVGPYFREIDPITGRGYFIYVPNDYTETKAWPVIVSCHGTPPYDVAEHHIQEFKYYGQTNGCIVIAPDCDGTDGIFGDGPTGPMLDDERFILSILSLLGYRYNIDMANIMITGFSGGGFPAYFVGLRNPDIFSTIVARNCNFSEHNTDGWFTPPDFTARPAAGKPNQQFIMIYYGENDPGTIKIQSDNGINYLRRVGYTVETTIIPQAGHDRHPEVAMRFFRENWCPPRPSLSKLPGR